MCNISSNREVKFLALGIPLLPTEINLLEPLRLNPDLSTPLVAHGLDLLSILHRLKRYILWAYACDQVVNIQDGLEIGWETETVPALSLQHYLQALRLLDHGGHHAEHGH